MELIQKQIHKSNKPKEFSETFIALNCNWLQVLNVTRNICAHHSRLFNRIFRIAPTKHKKIKELNLSNTKNIYYILMIINYYLLIIRSNSSFEEILKQLLGCYPQFYKPIMGFPENWAKFTYERTGKIVQNIK